MPQLKIVCWHDIPGQIIFRQGRRNTRLRLSTRFHKAIERASNRLKKRGEESQFDPWHSIGHSITGDINELSKLLQEWLEETYTDPLLERLIHAGGKDTAQTMDLLNV